MVGRKRPHGLHYHPALLFSSIPFTLSTPIVLRLCGAALFRLTRRPTSAQRDGENKEWRTRGSRGGSLCFRPSWICSIENVTARVGMGAPSHEENRPDISTCHRCRLFNFGLVWPKGWSEWSNLAAKGWEKMGYGPFYRAKLNKMSNKHWILLITGSNPCSTTTQIFFV